MASGGSIPCAACCMPSPAGLLGCMDGLRLLVLLGVFDCIIKAVCCCCGRGNTGQGPSVG